LKVISRRTWNWSDNLKNDFIKAPGIVRVLIAVFVDVQEEVSKDLIGT
jgi:hypothetical protein